MGQSLPLRLFPVPSIRQLSAFLGIDGDVGVAYWITRCAESPALLDLDLETCSPR
jgi:hypothetical protein